MARRQSGLSPTMTDVARLANVSQSCVSLVLNDAPGARVPDATRQRVIRAAEKLGYTLPAPRASAARARQTTTKNTVVLIVDEISVSPHSVLHIDGARDAAWTFEHSLQTYVTRANAQIEAAAVSAIVHDDSVIGVIYASSFMREVDVPRELQALPVVLLNCHARTGSYPTVVADDVSGGFAATQYLLAYGHERIAMISGERWMDVSRDRTQGYRQALETAGIAFDTSLVRSGDWSVESGYRRTMSLMRVDDPPTAFYCASDMMAIGCMEALTDLGLGIPQDASVVGHNDVAMAAHVRPPLSSCRPPSYEMGKRALELVLDAAQDGQPETAEVSRLECKLVVRSSVALRAREAVPREAVREPADR